MTERTTLEPIGEYAEIMEEMEEALSDPSRQKDDRETEDPQGMRLSQKSKITNAGQAIKQRTQAWRTDDGREAWLPSATIRQHLAKRRAGGQRVFVLRKPAIAERNPLDITCNVCVRARGESRKFYEHTQYEDHMEILHPREWQREQREQDRLERLEERAVLKALAERGVINAATESPKAEGACQTCGRSFASAFGLSVHERSHKGAMSSVPSEVATT